MLSQQKDATRLCGCAENEVRVSQVECARLVDGFDLDLYFPEVKVNVEVDGLHHREPAQQLRDMRRDRHLEQHHGIQIFRFCLMKGGKWQKDMGTEFDVAIGPLLRDLGKSRDQ